MNTVPRQYIQRRGRAIPPSCVAERFCLAQQAWIGVWMTVEEVGVRLDRIAGPRFLKIAL